MWEDIDYPGRFISKDRMAQWGSALHSQGMKYLAYNDTAAIQGPRNGNSVGKAMEQFGENIMVTRVTLSQT